MYTKGIILERHYVYHMCGPTRAATMSGRLPYHGNQNNANDLNSTAGVDLRMTFLPAKLKQAGYATSMIGKSHLGARSVMHLPIHRGFDQHFGFLGGGKLCNSSGARMCAQAHVYADVPFGKRILKASFFLTLTFMIDCCFLYRHLSTRFVFSLILLIYLH